MPAFNNIEEVDVHLQLVEFDQNGNELKNIYPNSLKLKYLPSAPFRVSEKQEGEESEDVPGTSTSTQPGKCQSKDQEIRLLNNDSVSKDGNKANDEDDNTFVLREMVNQDNSLSEMPHLPTEVFRNSEVTTQSKAPSTVSEKQEVKESEDVPGTSTSTQQEKCRSQDLEIQLSNDDAVCINQIIDEKALNQRKMDELLAVFQKLYDRNEKLDKKLDSVSVKYLLPKQKMSTDLKYGLTESQSKVTLQALSNECEMDNKTATDIVTGEQVMSSSETNLQCFSGKEDLANHVEMNENQDLHNQGGVQVDPISKLGFESGVQSDDCSTLQPSNMALLSSTAPTGLPTVINSSSPSLNHKNDPSKSPQTRQAIKRHSQEEGGPEIKRKNITGPVFVRVGKTKRNMEENTKPEKELVDQGVAYLSLLE
uniref:Uncharacterized protein n=1 Tax=Clytia hemisphaerica TaxID=252671 RepID=A0A7M5WR85_9CNID